MKEQHITISKTARFFTLGELNANTKHVCFVLHGYGYSAEGFLKKFEVAAADDTIFIAPEALNRFYLKGHGGNVGATWMTREDRENEMKDYINYLNDLYEHFDLEQYPQLKITALGFSQGSSAVSRWVNATKHRIDNTICYAGEVGAELLPLQPTSGLTHSKNYFVYGTTDEFIPLPVFEKKIEEYRDLKFTLVKYEGKHDILPDVLRELLAACMR